MKSVIALNTLFQLLGRTATSGAMFLVSILLASQYGPSSYGNFLIITTYISFFYLIVDFGANALFLNRTSGVKFPDTEWSSLFTLRIVLSIVCICLALAVLSLLPQGTTDGYTPLVRIGIILFAPSILFHAVIVSANALFQRELHYERSTFAVIVGSVVLVALVALIVYSTTSQVGMLLAVCASALSLLVSACLSLFLSRRYLTKRFTFRFHDGVSFFVQSMPLGLTLLFNIVYFRVDSFILSLTRSSQEVAYYGFAYKVFEFPLAFATFFMNAFYPVLLGAFVKGVVVHAALFRRRLFLGVASLIVGSVLSALVLWFGAPLFVYIRPEFASSIPALRVLSLGLPFFFVSSLMMWVLIALNKQRVLAVLYGTMMVLALSADVIFVPEYGYMAAAWITVIGEATILVVSTLLTYIFLSQKKHSTMSARI